MNAKLFQPPAQPVAAVRARRSRLALRRLALGWALVAPVVLWRLATSIYPFGYTAYLSFFDNSPVRRIHEFVGLANYTAMLSDKTVTDTLFFTVLFTVTSLGLQIIFALACAELLNRAFPLRGFARAVNLLPWAISGIVTGVAAAWVFNQDYGLINDLLWRVAGVRPLWLVNVTTARLAVILTDVWKNTPFLTVIFIGGLQGIPAELNEAAKIDGASGPRAWWHITLPLLMPLIISTSIFVAIARVLTFEIVYGLTQGGPGTATSLPAYQVYLQAFRVLNFGYASALSMGLFVVVLVVGLIGFALQRRSWDRT